MQSKMKFFCQETILYMYYVTIYINKNGKLEIVFNFGQDDDVCAY